MKIQHIKIRNFRGFRTFDLPLEGRSIFVIGENAGGKTSLLTAIARALGRDLTFTRADFSDIQAPIELEVTLSDFDQRQRGLFGGYIQFGNPRTLEVGVRAIWNEAAEDADVEHHYPRHAGSRSKREERDGIPLQWLPAWRDPSRMLQFGTQRNLMAHVLERLPIAQALEQAVQDVENASSQLGQDASIDGLLQRAQEILATLLPDVSTDAFSLGTAAMTGRDLLRQLELQAEHRGDPVPISRQSSGVAQLAIFVFAIELSRQPGTFLLIDEPEISLHPQSQRALMSALRALETQMIVATHSSNLLDRADPRSVVRLKRDQGTVTTASPSTIGDDDARRLARHTSPHTAEAFFARSVILVEGPSDQHALEALAERRGRNLDAEGVSIVPIGGANTIKSYLQLFGPQGFDLPLAGLVDEAEEDVYARGLQAAGLGNGIDRAGMEQLGFFVCCVDLEDELLRALGDQQAEQLIDERGDRAAFETFQQQPQHQASSLGEQLRAFIRKRKIEYAALLVDRLDLANVPRVLDEVLARV